MSVMIKCAGKCGCEVHAALMYTPPYAHLWFKHGGDPTPQQVADAACELDCFEAVYGNRVRLVPFRDVLALATTVADDKVRAAAEEQARIAAEELRRQELTARVDAAILRVEEAIRERERLERHRELMDEQQRERERTAIIRATISGHIAKRRSMQAA